MLILAVVCSGEIGCATKMKLMSNLLMGTVLAGLAEALALAEKIGLDHDEVMQILDMSPVSCSLLRNKGSGKDTHTNIRACLVVESQYRVTKRPKY